MMRGYFINQKTHLYPYNFENLRRRLLLTTLTLLSAIAAPAIIGSSKNPLRGYNTPAATGMPIRL